MFRTVKEDLGGVLTEEMRVALEFERGPPADDQLVAEQGLEREDGLLPVERTLATTVDAATRLGKPSGGQVLGTKGGGVAVSREPSGVDEEALREEALQPV